MGDHRRQDAVRGTPASSSGSRTGWQTINRCSTRAFWSSVGRFARDSAARWTCCAWMETECLAVAELKSTEILEMPPRRPRSGYPYSGTWSLDRKTGISESNPGIAGALKVRRCKHVVLRKCSRSRCTG